MEGEFDRECEEYGGCPPDRVLLTVGNQWEKVRSEIEKSVEKDSQKKVMKKVDAKWKELQDKKEVPGSTETKSLLPYLNKVTELAVADLEKHKQEEKQGLCAGRKWKKELEEKEEHRRVVSQMKAVCVLLQVEAKRKKHQGHSEKTHPLRVAGGVGNARPSAPEREEDPPTHDLYPELGPRPPPYHGDPPKLQAPILQVRDGILNLEELKDEPLERVKEYLQGEFQIQMEKLRDTVREIEQRTRLDESRNRERSGNDWGSSTSTSAPSRGIDNPLQDIGHAQGSGATYRQEEGAAKGEASKCGSQRDDAFDVLRLSPNNPFSSRMIQDRAERGAQDDYNLLIDLVEEGANDGSISVAAQMTGQLTIHSPQPAKTLQPEEEATKPSGHNYYLRSKSSDPMQMQMPLIEKKGGRRVYQPFSFTDMGCILDKMPNPTEGGGPWMSKLCQLTMGQKLAMGDWRALIGNQLGEWEIAQLESTAQTTSLPDNTPFLPQSTAIGQAMRKRFPVSQGAMHNLSFTPKEGEGIPDFLLRCKEVWTNVAGTHPGSAPLQQMLFRKAVMAGMPKIVQQVMEANPDIPGCDTQMWEKHLAHHYRQHKLKQEEAEADQTESHRQLLKLQLDDARRKVTDARKQKEQKGTQMVQQVPVTQSPQCPPQPIAAPMAPPPQYWPQPAPPQRHQWGPPRGGRGGFRGRGRGRGALQPPPPQQPGCFVCGQMSHWRRDCPYHNTAPGGWGDFGSGYGAPVPPHAPPQYPQQTPTHQAPNAAAAPPHGQYPVTEGHGPGVEFDQIY